MNISVDREASFEVSKRKSSFNLSVEQEASFEIFNRLGEEGIFTADQFVPPAPKKNDIKLNESTSSPAKVMDFEEAVESTEQLDFSEDSFTQWGAVSEEDLQEYGQNDFTPIVDGSFASDGDETPTKVLFPDSDNSRENSILASEGNQSKETVSLDENGFPVVLNSIDEVGSPDVYSSSFIDFDEMEDNARKEAEKSRWDRLLERIPEGTVKKAMQVRKQMLRCQDAAVAVTFDETYDLDTVGATTFKNDESMFSHSSFENFAKSVLGSKQTAPNATSKASTPMKERKGASIKEGTSMKLCIDLYEKAAFETLMFNLEGNTLVQEIEIFRSWDEGKEELNRSTEDIKLLFETIGSLSNLKTLKLSNFLAEDVQVASFGEWENKNLSSIWIHLCKSALSQTLMASLARLPALRDVTLEMNQSFPFHLLLHNRKIQSLTIMGSDFEMENLHVMELVQVLPSNGTLKKLMIEPDMKLRTFKLLASSLGQNMGLQEFKFSLRPGSEGDTTRVMTELARAVTRNGSLRTIRNLNHEKIEVEDKQACEAMMKALTKNYIIEDFLVFHEKPWFRVRKNRILRDNKMEYIDSLLTKLFKCENKDDASNRSMREELVKIGGTVKSEAQRVASGAMDLVNQHMGLNK